MPILINAESGLAENLDPQLAAQAAQQGSHEIPLIDPEGNHVTANIADAQELMAEGYKQPNQAQLGQLTDYAKYGTAGQQLATGLESAASTITFGGSRLIERGLGISAEEQRKREEINPKSALAGELAGLGASMATGFGIAPVMEAAGAATAAKLGLAAAETAGARIGSAAVKGAVENAIFQAGSEAGKLMISQDPAEGVGAAIADVGMATLLGAGVGATLGSVSELWKMTAGAGVNKALGHIEDMTLGEAGKLQKNVQFEQGVDELPSMFGKSIEDVQNISNKSVYEAGNEIKQSLLNKINEIRAPLSKEFENISAKFEKQALSKADKADIADALGDRLLIEGYSKMPNSAGAKLFQDTINHMPLQESVEDLRKYVSKLGEEHVANSATYMASKNIRQTINEAINNVIEKRVRVNAPELLESFTKAKADYSKMANLVDDLADRLSVRSGRSVGQTIKNISELDGEAVFKKASIKGDVELQNLLSKNFPEVASNVSKHELDKVLSNSLNAGKDAIDYKKLTNNINKLSPELREQIIPKEALAKLEEIKNLADQIPTRAKGYDQAEKMLDKMSPSNIALIAKMSDESFLKTFAQSVIGHKLGYGTPEAIKLAILKRMESGQPLNAGGFKNLLDYTNALVKGENKLAKGVKNIFNPSQKVAINVTVDNMKLKQVLENLQKNPEHMMNVGGDLGHYAPDQAAALAQTSANVVQYLQQLKPNTAPLGPLNKPRIPSKAEEAAYERALTIANNPSVILNSIKDGTLTAGDVNHLKHMYPSFYNMVQNKLNSELLNAVHNGTTIPYKTKLAMSIFSGQPMDYSMRPQAIMANQGQGQQMQQQQSKATPARADKLSKLPKSYATPEQQREASKSMGQ